MEIIRIVKVFVLFLLSISGIASAVSAVWTTLPQEASKHCFLGYYAHCSFTPISTVILIVLAVVFFLFDYKLIKSL